MTYTTRVASSVLLVTGVMFVFAGMSAALGFTPAGILASVAAIVTLLYAGGTWFGAVPTRHHDALVFDRALHVASGAASGTEISSLFPGAIRREIASHCAAALDGHSSRFTCEQDGVPLAFHAAPIRAADGTILYGILLTGAAASAPASVA